LLVENNVRTGFFEREHFEAVRAQLPADLRGVVAFAYITGWRMPSVLTLQWRQVDFDAGVVRLEPGTTRIVTAKGFPLTTKCGPSWRRSAPSRLSCSAGQDGSSPGCSPPARRAHQIDLQSLADGL